MCLSISKRLIKKKKDFKRVWLKRCKKKEKQNSPTAFVQALITVFRSRPPSSQTPKEKLEIPGKSTHMTPDRLLVIGASCAVFVCRLHSVDQKREVKRDSDTTTVEPVPTGDNVFVLYLMPLDGLRGRVFQTLKQKKKVAIFFVHVSFTLSLSRHIHLFP